MIESAFSDWLYRCFESLPRCKDDFFLKLWHNGRMRYAGRSDAFDTIDELSARLVCAALSNRKHFLIILPDDEPKRSAALFASALIMSSVDSINAGKEGGRVLYFGTKIGIRSQLEAISIRDLSLSSVFSQSYACGNLVSTQALGKLPHVTCIYSPLDPLDLVSRYNPRWVALDCSDSSSIPWIERLLPYLREKGIPLIAWSLNPLSSLKKKFLSCGVDVFEWPPLLLHPDLESKKQSDPIEVFQAFSKPIPPIDIIPCILTGKEAEKTSDHLSQAQKYLAEGMAKADGRMENDAMKLGWRYFRALERLSIPLDLFEAESMHYWGVSPISQIKEAFEKFITAIRATSRSSLVGNLEQAKDQLDAVYESFQSGYPPRWDALIELCLEDVPCDVARVLVFSGPAQKSMFSYALLARENTTLRDLADMRVFLLSFREASDLIKNSYYQNDEGSEDDILTENIIPSTSWTNWNLIHVTQLSQYHSERIIPFLRLKKFDILLYPFQLCSLSRKITKWNNELGIDILGLSKYLTGTTKTLDTGAETIKRTPIRIGDVRTLASRPKARKIENELQPIWEPRSDIEEIAYLFSNKDDEVDRDVFFETEDETDNRDAVVENALEVRFVDGWVGTFESSAKVNVVRHTPQGNKIEACYVKALRKGDCVLYIYGQKRQSLYDLVLSRIHGHPTIEIHLVMIRQWQNEVRKAFIKWLQNGKSINDLYFVMKEKGTHLESSLALKYWIAGYTLRPRDPEDLKRIADILGMSFTQEHYRRIHAAGARIHGLHISLSRRLNSWIQSGAVREDIQNDIIDEATGLSFTDIRDSLILLEVESIIEKRGLFDRSHLNKIDMEAVKCTVLNGDQKRKLG